MGAAFWRAPAKSGIGDFAGLHGYGPGDSAGDGRDCHEALPDSRELTKSKYLVLAGGVALNCVANGKVLRSGMFEDIWIQPAAGDAGGALGAAYAVWYIREGNRRVLTVVPTPCTARISDHRFPTGRLSESLAVVEQFPPIIRALMNWQNL